MRSSSLRLFAALGSCEQAARPGASCRPQARAGRTRAQVFQCVLQEALVGHRPGHGLAAVGQHAVRLGPVPEQLHVAHHGRRQLGPRVVVHAGSLSQDVFG